MIMISIDVSGLDDLRDRLRRIRGGLPVAIARGLNEGGDKVRTRVQRELKEQTGVKAYSSITSRISTMRAFPEAARQEGVGQRAMAYQIVAHGKGIPIAEFPVSVTSKGVDAKTWGVDHLFKRSFQQKKKGGLRARLTSSHEPIRALYGPALPKELLKGAVVDVFRAATAEFVPGTILKHVARMFE